MEIPGVSISLANGQIGGAPNSNDGVVGLVGTGIGGVALLTPLLIVSLPDAIVKGFTAEAEPHLYRHLKEFYDIAPIGSPIYVMAANETESLVSLLDKTNLNGVSKLINFAGGAIRALGIDRKPGDEYVPTTPQFIDSDCIESLTNARALVESYFEKIMPFRVIMGARVHDVASAVLFNPSTLDNNTVEMVVGGSSNDGIASLGYHLGKIAATPVHRNIGRIKDGALPVDTLYIGNKRVDDYAGISTLIKNGYSTFQTYPQKAGYFISDDPMVTKSTDDYRSLANCRVIDKASIVAYQTYLEEVKDDVDLDASGSIAAVDAKHLEAVITNNIMLAMSESISGEPRVFIQPGQNLATGAKLKVALRLVPKGYLKLIEVELGFSNPANS